MLGARDHTELDAWQLADAARVEVLRLTDRPSFKYEFDLKDQLRAAISSACSNIAEGFSRYLPRDFARFLRIANGSLSETIERIGEAATRGLVTRQEAEAVIGLAKRARGACTGLIRYLRGADPPE